MLMYTISYSNSYSVKVHITNIQSVTVPFMDLYNTMNDGYVPVLHLKNEDFTSLYRIILVVGEEQQVPSVEGWLHATTVTTVMK